MARALDLTGQRFGRWVVVRLSHKGRKGITFWECASDDGEVRVRRIDSVQTNLSAVRAAYKRRDKTAINARRREWWKKHRDEWIPYQKARYDQQRHGILERQRASRAQNPERTKERSKARAIQLKDWYVRAMLAQAMGVKSAQIPAHLVEAKREHLRVTHLLKEKRA